MNSRLTSTPWHAITDSWWKRAKQPDFNTVYCYHRKLMEESKATWLQHCILLIQKERSKAIWLQYYILPLQTLCHITTESWWKGAERPDFNTVYYHRRKGAKRPNFNTVYYYHRKLMEGSRVTWLQHHDILPQIVDGREQSDLTSTLQYTTIDSWWKGAERPDWNTVCVMNHLFYK